MALLSIANLTLSFGDRRILDGANLTLAHGEHVGLVGRNGCGKSTLMKLVAGLDQLRPDTGQVQLARGAVAGYLTQDPQLQRGRSLRDEAAAGFARLHELHRELERLSHDMAEAEGDEQARLLKQYERLEHEMHAAGGYAVDHEIDATLHGVGLGDETFGVLTQDLSGGQKGRLALAKLLLSKPDLLLLDEPTNHLDIAGRQWLEEYLAAFNGAVMVVSHDRWLLDRVATKIYELEDGRLVEYPGAYHEYVELRRVRRLSQQRDFDKQQQQIKREQAFIDRYRAGQRARQAKGREKRLERFIEQETIDRPRELDEMNVRFSPRQRCGDIVVTADHLSKRYDEKVLFEDVALSIQRGSRIGIIGPNGAGKTTLVNCLIGDMAADRGTARLGAGVSVGHFKQTHEHLDLALTVVEYLRRHVDDQLEQTARDLAGAFLFSGIEQDKPLGVLSGGERARAVIAALMSGGHNLLVLDEPTNHLDLASAERLEQAVARFTAPLAGYSTATHARPSGGGTLILISHDRALLDALVDQLIVFDGQGGCRLVMGNYSEYAAAETQRRADAAAQRAATAPARSPRPRSAPAAKPPGSPLQRMKQEALEASIVEIEARITSLDQRLADPRVYRDGGEVRRIQDDRHALLRELAPLEAEWQRRAENAP